MSDAGYFTTEQERCLIRSAQEGDNESRNRLIVAALPFVRRYLQCRFPGTDPQDFDDLVHEAVQAVMLSIPKYDLTHRSRARLYVFARPMINHAVAGYYRHSQVLSYTDDVPEIEAPDDPEGALSTEQDRERTLAALAMLSAKERDLLYSRLGKDKATPRRELAERYQCKPCVIQYAEHRAVDRLIAALPRDSGNIGFASVN